MMYKKMMIGDVEQVFCSCASVNVCYYNVFHEDFIKQISSDNGLAMASMMKMAFIMAKFGETNDRKAVNRLTEDNYCDWLDQFTTGELIEALPAVQEFYLNSAEGTIEAKKNNEEPKEK